MSGDFIERRMIFVFLLTRCVSDFDFWIQSLSSFSCCLEVLSGCDKVFKENLTDGPLFSTVHMKYCNYSIVSLYRVILAFKINPVN